MSRPQTIKAVFFDMDGVLYDSMPNHEYTWIHSLKEYGIDFPAEEAYMNEGRTGFSTIRIAFEKYLNRLPSREEEEAVYALKTKLMSERPKAPILPMMQELLTQLREKNIQVFVVTGSRQPSLVEKLSTHFGVAASNIISGADVKQGKPHPEPYLIAWQRSGLKKEECMVVENAPMGVESAKAAGIFTIAVNTGKLADKVLLDAGADELLGSTKALFNSFSF
ncbi:HAD-IA family hydrolase [Carboxylicivirga sp. A043]|uniref:HAD family hydrolase n=1 Tax=Carboxylicivirga litoralis TaxID=2816963 RepID=UPI0021CB81BB|nr:HAD-IA family hydrolase [Carboxylicivirga sp. A043]MCU4156907.1 HAD-IA family hydrolase [Carboxylicivirga sp. A043]